MPTQTAVVTVTPEKTDSPQAWTGVQCVAFRFCFVYFGLYILLTQMLASLLSFPGIDQPNLDTFWPTRQLVSWVAKHVFRHQAALVITGSGSGDKTFDWVEAFCLVVLAFVATVIWSSLSRKHSDHPVMYKWFYLLARFALGSTMLTYGFVKIIPLQMPFPFLSRLVEPFGNFSPMGVLWSSIGASTGYEIFTGCAETLAGVLVMIPRTAVLGALICLADVVNVFILNMTYDVPVKLFSFHLIVLSLILLAPHTTRLLNLFFRNRIAEPRAEPPLFNATRRNRIAFFVQMGFLFYLIAANLYGTRLGWKQYGGGAPKSILYGIWDVDEFIMDGQVRAPLLTDKSRWRRIVFQSPDSVTFQRMDDTLIRYGAFVYKKDQSFALALRDNNELKGNFPFQLPAQDRLVLDGAMDGHKIHMQLKLVDRDKFLLVSRGFHWVQEYPFNR